MDSGLSTEIWGRLGLGNSLAGLGLPERDGRYVVKGLETPSAKEFSALMESLGRPVEGADSSVVGIRDVAWDSIAFENCAIENTRLFRVSISNCTFDKCNLSRTRVWALKVSRAQFLKSDVSNAGLGGLVDGRQSNYSDVDFLECDHRSSSYGTALFTRCSFVRPKIRGVDFGGASFVDCKFEGELRDVIFRRVGNGTDAKNVAPNEMRNVDFRRALLRDVEFIGLDMDNVLWPESDEHIVITNYREMLDRMIAGLKTRVDTGSAQVARVLQHQRNAAGPNQTTGIISKWALAQSGDEQFVESVLGLIKPN